MPAVSTLRRLVPYYHPYRAKVAAGLLLVVAAAAAAALVPWLLRAAIDALRAGAPRGQIWRIGGGMVAAAILSGALRFGMRDLLNGVSRRIEYDLRNDLFGHLTTLDAAYFARMRTGDLMARLTNDLNAVRMAAGPAIMYLVNTFAGGLFALTFMLRIDGRLTLLAALPMVVLPALMVWLGRAIHTRFEAVQEHFGTLTTRAQENLSGVRVVRAYRQEDAELSRFATLNDEYLARNMRLVRLYGAMNPLFGLLAGAGAVVVLGAGGMLVLRGTISVGAFVAFGFYLAMLTWPLIALGWVINLFQRGSASMARLNAILDARAEVQSPRTPRPLPPAHGGRALEFRDVGFHYPTADGEPRWVLRHVSFSVPAGGTLGVVGATGSGKSSLLDLIPRLHDPQEGEILLDGVPLREIALDELRREVGVVPQESLLFSDTLESNLAYGTDDPAAGRWAAGVAQLDETIAGFPGGYQTMLGERGINLSGGQKQRAALARALARRPPVVLLDDALSAVDTHTEAAILHGLRDALGGRTAVIASHRISAIRDASWILVLDEGRVVEQGRHEELIAREGRYWSLLRRQQLVESIEGDEAPDPAGDGAAGG
ncbi:MAG TPA: ABC transporter ATP-binding protein [Gemmatimonadaceae bacterium]|nr:ABC transporter ATP-binding protein [Gemmatimonadaceae bacterium]